MNLRRLCRIQAIIRTPVPADVPTVYRVEVDCFKDPWSRSIFLTLARYPRGVVLNSEVAKMAVAEIERSVAGYVVWAEHFNGTIGQIMNLAVESSHRGKGIGKELLLYAFDEMREAGISTCSLEVRESNQPARQLYESQGMASTGRIPLYYGDEDAITYETTL
jgi:ribosomal-protein-alanine N-acetyltransferase